MISLIFFCEYDPRSSVQPLLNRHVDYTVLLMKPCLFCIHKPQEFKTLYYTTGQDHELCVCPNTTEYIPTWEECSAESGGLLPVKSDYFACLRSLRAKLTHLTAQPFLLETLSISFLTSSLLSTIVGEFSIRATAAGAENVGYQTMRLCSDPLCTIKIWGNLNYNLKSVTRYQVNIDRRNISLD